MRRKCLAIGIIVLFLGMSITPTTASLQDEKHSSIHSSIKELDHIAKTTKTGSRGFNITVTGTMGENGWYVSNVVITFTADNGSNGSIIMHLYYKFHDEDPWTEYTGGGPLMVSTDGYYSFSALILDQFGNQWNLGPVPFKIDKTAPTIDLTITSLNCLKNKWLLNATVFDATSGVAKVEFYVDDVLVGNATAYPYTFTYKGRGKIAQAVDYDNAGNSCMQSMDCLRPQQKNSLFHDIIYNLIQYLQMKIRHLLD